MSQIISGLRTLPRAAALAMVLALSVGLVASTPTKVMANSLPQICPWMRNYQVYYYDQMWYYWYQWRTSGYFEYAWYEGQYWDGGHFNDAGYGYYVNCGWIPAGYGGGGAGGGF
jgi:hypothetical protein